MRIAAALLFALCLGKVTRETDLQELGDGPPGAKEDAGPEKPTGAIAKYLANRRSYTVTPAARIAFAKKQLKKGALLKTTWHKCIVRVNPESTKCWMVQTNCRVRNRMIAARQVTKLARKVGVHKKKKKHLERNETDMMIGLDSAEIETAKAELAGSKKVRCFPKERVQIEEMDKWSFMDAFKSEEEEESDFAKKSKYRIVVTKDDGSYRKKFINVSPTFADALRLIMDPTLADKPQELTHDLEYGACVSMGDKRAKQKAVLHMFLGLSNLLGFIPIAGGFVSEAAADSIRTADGLYRCEGILRDQEREMSNEQYDAWMETDEYILAFEGCLKDDLSRIFAVDNWDSIIGKMNMIAAKTIKGFTGFVTLPIAITMAVKDIFIAMAMAKVQYDHARSGYFVSCLHESVRTMDKDLLKVISLMDEVQRAIDHRGTVQYALVYERLSAIARVVEHRAASEPMRVQQMIIEDILPFVNGDDTKDSQEIKPKEFGELRTIGTHEYSQENEFKNIQASLVECMGLAQQTLDLLTGQSVKVAIIRDRAHSMLDRRVQYYKHVEMARAAEMEQFENRMYYIDIVRYPIDYVVKNIYSRVKKLKGTVKVAAQEQEFQLPALIRREQSDLSAEDAALARIEKLAGLERDENNKVEAGQLLDFLAQETATIRAVMHSRDIVDRTQLEEAEKVMTHVRTVAEKLEKNDMFELGPGPADAEISEMIDENVQESEDVCRPKTQTEAEDLESLAEADTDFADSVGLDSVELDFSDSEV